MIKTKIGRAAGFGAAEAAPLAVLKGLMRSVGRYAELDGQRQTAMGFPQPAEPLGQLGECRAASQVERKS